MLSEEENQEAGDDGIVHVDKADREARSENRSRQPVSFAGVSVWFISFLHPGKENETGGRQNHLSHRGMLERPHPVAEDGSRGHAAPDAAADVAERLAAAMNACELDRPRGRSRVKARFPESMKNARQIHAANTQGREICGAGERAAEKAHREDKLAAAPVRKRSRDEPGGERHEGKDADHETHGFVGPAQVVTDVRTEFRQHGCNAQKAEKGRGGHCPELGRELSQ